VNRDLEDLGGVSPYELLGVPPDADTADVKRAYRRLAPTAHPDIGGDAESLKRLNLAREVLLDPARRTELDRRLRQRRNRDGEVTGEARVPGPASYANQFSWRYGTGPGRPQASYARDATARPEPKPQTTPAEDQFGWTYGAGPTRYRRPPPAEPVQKTVYGVRVYWHGYVGQPQSRARRRWSRLAIAALAMSVIVWPAALPAGIVALIRVRRRNERGAVLAWITIAWGLVVLCAIAIKAGWT
jgi:curved DNA-binding protein CbpA